MRTQVVPILDNTRCNQTLTYHPIYKHTVVYNNGFKLHFLVTSDVKYHFMCLFAFHISFSVNCWLKSSPFIFNVYMNLGDFTLKWYCILWSLSKTLHLVSLLKFSSFQCTGFIYIYFTWKIDFFISISYFLAYYAHIVLLYLVFGII